ncbi:23S rRNA (adenine(2503)-C(2))-methyltransferase RlmN [Terriglobus aquaticus]|uniref:Probable dual-specificity RNA methyltransferase RlmN n=1 Tax=Terriglobus aquaticus TaxID=940139 RepID=A0ABW9KRI4_9BACT|nr:23S rRNA (adenine(2503)-C(2))-methyltransferase RlmN [Terriglobus aquaticus]
MATLFGLTLPELTERMTALGQKPFRARQLWDALYRGRVASLDEVTTLSQELRERMAAEGDVVGLPEMVQTATSVDGTERYLVRMADGETVETVWMPDGDGAEAPYEDDEAEAAAETRTERNASLAARRLPHGANAMRPVTDARNRGALAEAGYRRATICVSSQVGCAVNCQFCLTAKLGIKRNLTPGEIAGQVAAVLNRHRIQVGRDRINLVFMGMGEPFLNYDNFMAAVRLLVEGMGLPESRMTVSTSGIEPAIRRFAQEAVRPRLALSLNASNDAVREQVMPITRKWNIQQLLDAVQTIPLGKRDWVTFEYVLLGGVNDRPEHAQEVLDLLRGIPSKVNLIVWNPGPGIAYTQPLQDDVDRFQKALIAGGIPTYIRRPRGRDIYAACGQLKRTVAENAEPRELVTLVA